MNLDVVSRSELLQLANQQLLYGELVIQLKKDFLLANIDLDITDNIEGEALFMVLREKMYYLIMERFSEYLNLIYIVDIPEKEFQYVEMTDAVEVANQMTFLILKREYQKVWFKNTYE